MLLTVAPRYEGYHGAIGRLITAGDPPAEIRRAFDVAIEAEAAAASELRPGVEGRKAEAIAVQAGRVIASRGSSARPGP